MKSALNKRLVLSRRVGEKIIILWGGVKIILSVNEMSSNQVNLGIDAPKEICIYREELWERLTAGNPKRGRMKFKPKKNYHDVCYNTKKLKKK